MGWTRGGRTVQTSSSRSRLDREDCLVYGPLSLGSGSVSLDRRLPRQRPPAPLPPQWGPDTVPHDLTGRSVGRAGVDSRFHGSPPNLLSLVYGRTGRGGRGRAPVPPVCVREPEVVTVGVLDPDSGVLDPHRDRAQVHRSPDGPPQSDSESLILVGTGPVGRDRVWVVSSPVPVTPPRISEMGRSRGETDPNHPRCGPIIKSCRLGSCRGGPTSSLRKDGS